MTPPPHTTKGLHLAFGVPLMCLRALEKKFKEIYDFKYKFGFLDVQMLKIVVLAPIKKIKKFRHFSKALGKSLGRAMSVTFKEILNFK